MCGHGLKDLSQISICMYNNTKFKACADRESHIHSDFLTLTRALFLDSKRYHTYTYEWFRTCTYTVILYTTEHYKCYDYAEHAHNTHLCEQWLLSYLSLHEMQQLWMTTTKVGMPKLEVVSSVNTLDQCVLFWLSHLTEAIYMYTSNMYMYMYASVNCTPLCTCTKCKCELHVQCTKLMYTYMYTSCSCIVNSTTA